MKFLKCNGKLKHGFNAKVKVKVSSRKNLVAKPLKKEKYFLNCNLLYGTWKSKEIPVNLHQLDPRNNGTVEPLEQW